jgi:hypothetical protein
LDIPLIKPIYPGKNLVSIEYQTTGEMSYTLDDLNIAQSGFTGASRIEESDELKVWDNMQKKYEGPLWRFKDETGHTEWVTQNYVSASGLVINGGSGLLIDNKGLLSFICFKRSF